MGQNNHNIILKYFEPNGSEYMTFPNLSDDANVMMRRKILALYIDFRKEERLKILNIFIYTPKKLEY